MCTTPMQSPASTRTLTSMLIPRPKKALRSPRVQNGTAMRSGSCDGIDGKRFQEVRRGPDPAEDPALGGDHPQGDLVELGEVGAAAVAQHEALEAAVVGLAHGRVHADLGGDAGDDQRPDPAVAQD